MTDAEIERMLALDAGPGPALPISTSHADAIVEAALAGAGYGPGGGSGGSGAGTAAGTKLAIIGGAAIVAIAVALLVGRRHRGHEEAVPPADAAIADDRGGSGSLALTDEPPAPPTVAPLADANTSEEITIDPPAGPTRTKAAPKASAADLLGEANAKRAAKQWRESDRLYARVVDRAPRSLAAQSALIASASLHLEHFRDPKGAAQRLRKALAIAPSGALAEEARWGLAEAARALHDRNAEAAALDDFLAHHASSPLAPRAKARRAELP